MSATRKGIRKSLYQRQRMIEGWKKRRAKILGIPVYSVPPTAREIEVCNLMCGSACSDARSKSVCTAEATSERMSASEKKKACSKPWMKKVDVQEWVKRHGKIQLY